MYAVYEFRTNEQGIMTDTLALKTPNSTYAQSKIYELAAAAVGSSVYVHTILCVDEHGDSKFGTPLYFEHASELAE
jgi:hypothetical protein